MRVDLTAFLLRPHSRPRLPFLVSDQQGGKILETISGKRGDSIAGRKIVLIRKWPSPQTRNPGRRLVVRPERRACCDSLVQRKSTNAKTHQISPASRDWNDGLQQPSARWSPRLASAPGRQKPPARFLAPAPIGSPNARALCKHCDRKSPGMGSVSVGAPAKPPRASCKTCSRLSNSVSLNQPSWEARSGRKLSSTRPNRSVDFLDRAFC